MILSPARKEASARNECRRTAISRPDVLQTKILSVESGGLPVRWGISPLENEIPIESNL